MATVSIKSNNNNHTETYSLDTAPTKTNQLRDPSFSSYLNASENSVRKLAAQASTRPNGLSFSFNNPQGLLDLHRYLGHTHPQEDEEIEVFEAEKYFNGAMDPADQDLSPPTSSPKLNYTSPIPTPTPTMKEVNFPKKEQEQEQMQKQQQQKDPVVEQTTATVSISSSTNSQSAFLAGRSVHDQYHRKKSSRRSFLLAALGCKCSCSDSGSVDVVDNDDDVAPATSTKTTTTTTDQISSSSWKSHNNYPAVSSNPWMSEAMMKRETFHQEGFTTVKVQTSPKQDKNPRKSLEVFGSISPSSGIMESFLSMDQKTKPTTISAGTGEIMMDTDSDASSDLFEIESLTGKVDSYLTRQTSDATSDLYPTATRYAPSEASIEWSVVTASAADFSLMSDFEEMNNLSSRTNDMKLRRHQVMDPKKIGKNGGDVHRRLSSGNFLGCKSQKAVEVAGDAFRSVSRRFRGEERQVDSRQVHRGLSDLGFSDAAARFQPRRDEACSRFDLVNGELLK